MNLGEIKNILCKRFILCLISTFIFLIICIFVLKPSCFIHFLLQVIYLCLIFIGPCHYFSTIHSELPPWLVEISSESLIILILQCRFTLIAIHTEDGRLKYLHAVVSILPEMKCINNATCALVNH